MELGRVRVGESGWLARLEGGGASLLLAESRHPAADALREALSMKEDLARGGTFVEGGDYEFLAPLINPSKFICIGLNYADHAAEAGVDLPEDPVMFAKFPTTIIGPTDTIHFRTADTT